MAGRRLGDDAMRIRFGNPRGRPCQPNEFFANGSHLQSPIAKDLCRPAILLAQQTEHQVFRTDMSGAHPLSLFRSVCKHAFGLVAQLQIFGRIFRRRRFRHTRLRANGGNRFSRSQKKISQTAITLKHTQQ